MDAWKCDCVTGGHGSAFGFVLERAEFLDIVEIEAGGATAYIRMIVDALLWENHDSVIGQVDESKSVQTW